MCIFSKAVSNVSNTRIVVADKGERQLTVYSNAVTLFEGSPSAMILPVPTRDGGMDIDILETSACGTLFNELDSLFPRSQEMNPSDASSDFVDPHVSRGLDVPLPVLRSGFYRYSIVPCVEDFFRLRHETFGIHPDAPLASVLRAKYSTSFAFVVCVLDEGIDASKNPIAYVHPKHTSGMLFVPTRHAHGASLADVTKDVADEWDHVIYAVGAVFLGDMKSRSTKALATTDPRSPKNSFIYTRSASSAFTAVSKRYVRVGSAYGSPQGAPYSLVARSSHALRGSVDASASASASVSVSAEDTRSRDLLESLKQLPNMVFLGDAMKTLGYGTPTFFEHVFKIQVAGAYTNDDLFLGCATQLLKAPATACTTLVTRSDAWSQSFFACATCMDAGRFSCMDCVCAACARACHAALGHAVICMGEQEGVCDCGTKAELDCVCIAAGSVL